MKIDKPGVYDIPEFEYHQDPAPEPSLTKTIASTLLDKSPRHAWAAHPRLNKAFRVEREAKFDLGSGYHDALFTGGKNVDVLDYPSYQSKDAKAQREAAYDANRIPLLLHQYENAVAMVRAAHQQIPHLEDVHGFADPREGKPEQAMFALIDGVWVRILVDWLPHEGVIFYDYKTTSGSANPDEWCRSALWASPAIQSALYRRVIRAVMGIEEPRFKFVVQENYEPYALSCIELGPRAIEHADEKLDEAFDIWRRCLETGKWPGYPARTVYADVPPFVESRWQDRQIRDLSSGMSREQLFAKLIDWQAPKEGKAA